MAKRSSHRKANGLKLLKYGKEIEISINAAPGDDDYQSEEEACAGRKRKRNALTSGSAQPNQSRPTQPRNKEFGQTFSPTLPSAPRTPGPALALLHKPPTTSTSSDVGRVTREELAKHAIRSAVAGGELDDSEVPMDSLADGRLNFSDNISEYDDDDLEMTDDHAGLSDFGGRDGDAFADTGSEGLGNEVLVGSSSKRPGPNQTEAAGSTGQLFDDEAAEPMEWEQDENHACKSTVTHRSGARNAMLGYVRYIIASKLGWDEDSELLPLTAPPEVAAPTSRAFFIRWEESESSLFNSTAAHIVADQVLEDWPDIVRLYPYDKLVKAASNHISYLRTVYKQQTDDTVKAKEQARRRRCAARTRKATLLAHRTRVVNELPGLGRHARLIETLSLEGTSSDEEDPNHKGVYIIRRRKELSPQVKHLKSQLDQAYRVHFKGPGSKGSQVRQRVDNGVISTRRFKVQGLPTSCIDPGWLMTLTDIQKRMFEFDPANYDFSFPLELLESV